jgi:hypothetical protein
VTGPKQERTKPERTYQRACCNRSFPAFADPGRRLCNQPSIPSPQYVPFAWRDGKDDAKHRNVRSTHSLLLQPEASRTTCYGSPAVWLYRHPLYRRPSDKCFHRAPILPYFPCSPSVTRSMLYPRPAARRVSASASPPSRVSVFSKSCVQRTQKDFPNLPKKTPLGLGSGAHSRRFAQECPEGTPGKYKQGEKQWHSTKTRSL